jgi:Flagellar transcriptional activator (FlhC)
MLDANKAVIEAWSELIISTGARSCTAQAITGLTEINCRRQYFGIHGTKSPSGQKPSDEGWFTKNKDRIYASSLFLVMFVKCAEKEKNKGIAFMHAYYLFWRLSGSPPINAFNDNILTPERADNLRKRFGDAKAMRAGKSPHHFYTCGKCRSPFLGVPNTAHQICVLCEE